MFERWWMRRFLRRAGFSEDAHRIFIKECFDRRLSVSFPDNRVVLWPGPREMLRMTSVFFSSYDELELAVIFQSLRSVKDVYHDIHW